MNRRAFWKYFAAVPVAAVAPLIGARELTEVPAAGIVLEGNNITLHNLSVEGGIQIKSGSGNCLISGCIVKS